MKRILHDDIEMDYDENGTIIYLNNGQLFTGIAYEVYPDGKLKSESRFEQGFEHPYLKEWYPDGKPKYEQLEIDKRFITIKEWFETGVLKKEMTHELGFCILLKEWNEEGNIIEEFEMTEKHPSFIAWKNAVSNFENKSTK